MASTKILDDVTVSPEVRLIEWGKQQEKERLAKTIDRQAARIIALTRERNRLRGENCALYFALAVLTGLACWLAWQWMSK